jgi:hypothetical protein
MEEEAEGAEAITSEGAVKDERELGSEFNYLNLF